MARTQRYVNTASTAGGDGTTNATTGANRAYAMLRDALVAITADFTATAQDTVTFQGQAFANIVYEIICDKAGGNDVSSGGTCRTNVMTGLFDATHKLLIRAADNSWPNKLQFDTGYAIKYSVGTSGIGALTSDTNVPPGALVVAGIQCENTNTGTLRHGICDQSYGSSSPDGERNIWYGCLGKTSSSSGIGIKRNSRVNLIYCRGSGAATEGSSIGSSGNNAATLGCLFDHNTNLGLAIGTSPDGTNTAYNNVCVGNTAGDYTSGMTLLAGTNNASGDSTAPGSSAQTSVSLTDGVDFTSPSTNDYMPTVGGKLKDTGANLVSLGFLTNAVDVMGNARSTWDIGPIEYIAPSGGFLLRKSGGGMQDLNGNMRG